MATKTNKPKAKPTVKKPVPKTDRELAAEAAKALSRFPMNGDPVTLTLNGKTKMEVLVPGTIVKAIERACRTEYDEEMTTQEAADFLNVSRPYLIRLLEEGKIPFRLVGEHRRIRRNDVFAFDRVESARRRVLLDQLIAEGQELGLGYSSPMQVHCP